MTKTEYDLEKSIIIAQHAKLRREVSVVQRYMHGERFVLGRMETIKKEMLALQQRVQALEGKK